MLPWDPTRSFAEIHVYDSHCPIFECVNKKAFAFYVHVHVVDAAFYVRQRNRLNEFQRFFVLRIHCYGGQKESSCCRRTHKKRFSHRRSLTFANASSTSRLLAKRICHRWP